MLIIIYKYLKDLSSRNQANARVGVPQLRSPSSFSCTHSPSPLDLTLGKLTSAAHFLTQGCYHVPGTEQFSLTPSRGEESAHSAPDLSTPPALIPTFLVALTPHRQNLVKHGVSRMVEPIILLSPPPPATILSSSPYPTSPPVPHGPPLSPPTALPPAAYTPVSGPPPRSMDVTVS